MSIKHVWFFSLSKFTIPKIHSRATAFALAILTACICSLTGSRAMAWGMMTSLNGPHKKAHLVFPVYEHHSINYCLRLDRKTVAAGHFHYRSVNIEIRMALRQWLNAVKKITGFVEISRVRCFSPKLNLMVTIGPKPSGTVDKDPSFSWAEWNTGFREYYHAFVISTYRYFYNGTSYPTYDLQYVVKQYLASKNLTLRGFIKMISADQTSFDTIAGFVQPQWGYASKPVVYNTSYGDLLHEFGHAFGLCDTYNVKLNCDPDHVSNWYYQPKSVMSAGNFLHLSTDDIAGIRHLFLRFFYLSNK